MENGKLVKFESLPSSVDMVDADRLELLKRLLCTPGALERLQALANNPSAGDTAEQCRRLANRCDATDMMLETMLCPGHRNYSQRTLDEFSDNSQVNLESIVTGLGGDYVNAFPVPPTKLIRLTHLNRPGFTPTKIAIDLNLAGGANNYLDFTLQFYLVPGGAPSSTGLAIGNQMRGNQFLNKDGTQIHINFPEYRNCPLDIGSLESLALVIHHTGAANNLDSAFVTVYYDNRAFYAACKKKCGVC